MDVMQEFEYMDELAMEMLADQKKRIYLAALDHLAQEINDPETLEEIVAIRCSVQNHNFKLEIC